MRKIGPDQIETAAGDRQPHVAAVQVGDASVSELAEQQRARGDGFVLNIDAAKRGGTQRAHHREHHAAARADLQDAGVSDAASIGPQGLDKGRGVFAGAHRRNGWTHG